MLRSFYLNLLEITESHLLAVIPNDEHVQEYAEAPLRASRSTG